MYSLSLSLSISTELNVNVLNYRQTRNLRCKDLLSLSFSVLSQNFTKFESSCKPIVEDVFTKEEIVNVSNDLSEFVVWHFFFHFLSLSVSLFLRCSTIWNLLCEELRAKFYIGCFKIFPFYMKKHNHFFGVKVIYFMYSSTKQFRFCYAIMIEISLT